MKRKKYAEELEARLSDEEVKVIVKAKKANTAASKQPAVQLFVVSSCYSVVAKRATLFPLLVNHQLLRQEFVGLKTIIHAMDCSFTAMIHRNILFILTNKTTFHGRTIRTKWWVNCSTAYTFHPHIVTYSTNQDHCSMTVQPEKIHIQCPFLII